MSYSKRIPSALRGQFARFTRSINPQKRSYEQYVIDNDYIISTGSLRFVKHYYTTFICKSEEFPVPRMGGGYRHYIYDNGVEVHDRGYKTLEVAVRAGNWSMFRHLNELFYSRSYDNVIFPHVMMSMIEQGNLDWIQKYLHIYPNIPLHNPEDSKYYMIFAMAGRHEHIIRYLVSKGMTLKGREIDDVEIIALGGLDRFGNTPSQIELGHLYAFLLPVFVELRTKYPDQIDKKVLDHLASRLYWANYTYPDAES